MKKSIFHPAETAECGKQDSFPFHHRQSGTRANIPQSEYSAAIRDHRHAITLAGIVKDGIWPGHNLVRGLGNPGGQVKRTEDEMIANGHLGVNLQQPLIAVVQFECLFLEISIAM